MQQEAIRQGFCCEEPATGAHGLLANPLAAAKPSSLADSGVSATTSDDLGPSLLHSDMGLDLDVSIGLTDSDADAEGVTDDEVVMHSPTPSAPYPLLRSSGMHDHPDEPGFVVPERGDASTVTGRSIRLFLAEGKAVSALARSTATRARLLVVVRISHAR